MSGSLTLPKRKAPKGGWPVISYAHGTTGSADACAPSRGYDTRGIVSYAYPLLRRWLKAGYAVVRTDYDGLGTPGVHTYVVGRSEGRAVLDVVRAAQRLGAGPTAASPVGFYGYSQGGGGAAQAAQLAASYAPELQVKGTAAGGIPADMIAVGRARPAMAAPARAKPSAVTLSRPSGSYSLGSKPSECSHVPGVGSSGRVRQAG